MKKSRFSEEQIIGMIKEQESGIATAEVCRKHGISTASFYKYKSKFGGLDVSDAKKLKSLTDENAKLSQRRACDVLDVDRSSVRYTSIRPDDSNLRKAMKDVAAERRRFGYRRIHVMLERKGISMKPSEAMWTFRHQSAL